MALLEWWPAMLDLGDECRLPKLQTLVLTPGNAALCGPLPNGTDIEDESGSHLMRLLQPVCPTHDSVSDNGGAIAGLAAHLCSLRKHAWVRALSPAACAAGIVVGVVAALALAGLAIWYFWFWRNREVSCSWRGSLALQPAACSPPEYAVAALFAVSLACPALPPKRLACSCAGWTLSAPGRLPHKAARAAIGTTSQGMSGPSTQRGLPSALGLMAVPGSWAAAPLARYAKHLLTAVARESPAANYPPVQVFKALLNDNLEVAVKTLHAEADLEERHLSDFAKEVAFMHSCRCDV